MPAIQGSALSKLPANLAWPKRVLAHCASNRTCCLQHQCSGCLQRGRWFPRIGGVCLLFPWLVDLARRGRREKSNPASSLLCEFVLPTVFCLFVWQYHEQRLVASFDTLHSTFWKPRISRRAKSAPDAPRLNSVSLDIFNAFIVHLGLFVSPLSVQLNNR